MTHPLISRLHDWRDLLGPGAISGARLDGHAVRDLIGTLIACAAALDDSVGLTIELAPHDYTVRPDAGRQHSNT